MTIGADTALHRITEAIDAISSTASSHRRTFVVEVMGRHCGYLALMSADRDGRRLGVHPGAPAGIGPLGSRDAGRRAQGRARGGAARRDCRRGRRRHRSRRAGRSPASTCGRCSRPGSARSVRITVLGHVQRGGAPSAFDRNLGTIMGHAAVDALLAGAADEESQVIGMRGNRVVRIPLAECVSKSREINKLLEARDYARALELRGRSFTAALGTLQDAAAGAAAPAADRASGGCGSPILNVGAPAPGMNTAVRAAVRIAIDQGHVVLGVRRGFQGLADDDMQEMAWMSVNGWAGLGGAGARHQPRRPERPALPRHREDDRDGTRSTGCWSSADGRPTRAPTACSQSGRTSPPSGSRWSACPPRSTTTCRAPS